MAETPVDGPSLHRRGPSKYNIQRQLNVREGREWAQKCTWLNPKYRWRIHMAAQNGTLHPMLERALWEMGGYLPKGNKPDDLDLTAVRGLINMLLRKPLNVDPLAEAKPVGTGSTMVEPPTPALAPHASIVPPSRPKKVRGTGPPLKPGEEVMT